MPRNMSFSITTDQYRNHAKTVTRRLGWWNLQPGIILNGVVKAMGLKPGEKVHMLGQHRVVSVRREILNEITQSDVIAEGFPDMTPDQFVDMFCGFHGCDPWTIVNRIEFEYI